MIICHNLSSDNEKMFQTFNISAPTFKSSVGEYFPTPVAWHKGRDSKSSEVDRYLHECML